MEALKIREDKLILNHRCALTRFSKDLDLYIEICDVFYGTVMEYYVEVTKAVSNDNIDDVTGALHALTGASLNIGAERLASYAKGLEKEIKESKSLNLIKEEKFDNLQVLIEEAKAKIEELIPEKKLPAA